MECLFFGEGLGSPLIFSAIFIEIMGKKAYNEVVL